MKSLILLLVISFFAFTGCVTMPDPVPDTYLVEKTADEGKALDKLANTVIAKNQEIKALKVKVADEEQKMNVEKGRLNILSEEKKLLTEKKKQFELEKDTVKIEENTRLIEEKDKEIVIQTNKVEHASATLEYAHATKDVAETELGVLVAELNVEKSKIAKAYLIKNKDTAGKEQSKGPFASGPEKYDERYQKYLDKQRETLVSKKNEKEKASNKVKIAEEKLNK